MKSHQDPDVRLSRQSHPYYTDRYPYYATLSYPTQLIEDVALQIMPIGGKTDSDLFEVVLSPPDDRFERVIREGLSRRDYLTDLPGVVSYFFQLCCRTVMAYSEAFYEIGYLIRKGHKEPIGFDLLPIHPDTVNRKGDRVFQQIPRDEALKHNIAEIIPLESTRVVVFSLPEHIRASYAKMMDRLIVLSMLPPGSVLLGQHAVGTAAPFNLEAQLKGEALALADAAKDLGWSGRSTLDPHALPLYIVYRRLRFERFLIELRSSLIQTLNEALKHVGLEMGFESQIVVRGIPRMAEVEAAFTDLMQGSRSLKDIVQPFRWRNWK